MLINENIVTKYNFVRMYWMEKLKKNLNAFAFDMDKIFYYREGRNACHDFALDPERLALILELFQDEDPELFSMLLMPDKDGNSPFDIALDKQSPKSLELMMPKLATLTSVKRSHLVLDRFKELLQLDLQSFPEFLGSCMFQTP